MAKFPSKPTIGQPAIKQLHKSINEIIDYLPSLDVKGDQKSTYVTKSSAGTVIHAAQTASTTKEKALEYFAGSGLQLLSGNVFNVGIDDRTIKLVNNKLSCVVSGGGGGSDTNDTYIGDANYYNYLSGNHIYISPDANYNGSHLVSSTLNWLQELNNPPIINDTRPLSSEISTTFVYPDHFMQFRDWIGNKGQNTIVTSGSFINTHMGAGEPGSWEYIFQYTGPQVDCLLTGGRFIDVHSHWQDSGGETPEQQEPDDHTINSLLSGDNSHIFITQQSPNADGSWGGIISTNIHGDETTIHMAEDGTLSCIGAAPSPTPAGSGFIPDWGHSKHDFGVPPTTSKPQHPTVAEHDGYLFAWASFNPSQLGYCFQTAQAHIVVNDAWMKVCEVSYPDKFYIVVNNNKFERYPYGDIIHQMMLTGTTAGSGDTTQTISPTLYYRNDGDDVWDENNEYVQYHGWTASSRDEILPSKIFTQNYLLRPFNENWSIYFKKYNVYEYQNGQRGSWLTSYIDGYNINVSDLLQSIGYTGNWEEEAFFDQQWGLKGSAGNQIDRACWQYNGDYIYTNGSIDNNTSTYELTQTGLDEKRQDYDYVGDVTDNNMKMQAIGVGGGLCVPFRKGATLSYVVNMDGRAVNIPTNYGTSGMTWAPNACCIVYYNHST